MSTPKDGGPAFPAAPNPYKTQDCGSIGMSLRDYFAAKALPGIQASWEDTEENYKMVALEAYKIADAMLAEREKFEP